MVRPLRPHNLRSQARTRGEEPAGIELSPSRTPGPPQDRPSQVLCSGSSRQCLENCLRHITELSYRHASVKAAQLCPTLRDPVDYSPWTSPGKNTGVGCCSFLQGIFPTQRSNQFLIYHKQILYHWAIREVPSVKTFLAKSSIRQDPHWENYLFCFLGIFL